MADEIKPDAILEWSFRIIIVLIAAVIITILLSEAVSLAHHNAGSDMGWQGAQLQQGEHFIRAVNYYSQPGCTLLPPINMTIGNGTAIGTAQ